jgi:predicted XRE-type DNA-binding protein
MEEHHDPVPALKQQVRNALIAAVGRWQQSVAAGAIGTDQPRMSDLERNRLERFSLETLIRLLARIDHRVELVVHPPPSGAFRVFRF